MSLEEIRKSIDRDAKAQAGSIGEAGAAEAAAILKAARLSAAEMLKAAKEEANRETERVRKEKISEAQIEIGSLLVGAKESVLDRHIEPLKRSIASQLSGKKLDKVLSGAAKEFAKFSSKSHMVVRTGGKNTSLAKRLGYQTVRGSDGDLSVESRDGSVSIDASPAGLTEMYAPQARTLLAAKLWKVEKKVKG
jgi:V/A-type H+-transporting ATPase subunit E